MKDIKPLDPVVMDQVAAIKKEYKLSDEEEHKLLSRLHIADNVASLTGGVLFSRQAVGAITAQFLIELSKV
jgi:hypothetical protein